MGLVFSSLGENIDSLLFNFNILQIRLRPAAFDPHNNTGEVWEMH